MAEEEPAKGNESAARMAASKVAEEQRNGKSPEDADVVELGSGLKIRVHEVPPLVLRQPLQHLPEPKPPLIPLPEKGEGIEEPNPNDPDYIKAHDEWESTLGLATMDTMLLLGTTEPTKDGEPKPLIEHCPDDMMMPEAEGWIKWLEAAGVSVDISTPNTRYLCWLRYYAVSNAKDLGKLMAAIAGKSGVQEDDVANAATSFPGDETRGADSGPAPKPNRANRRALQRPSSRSRSRS
jgi:hypothetical protein